MKNVSSKPPSSRNIERRTSMAAPWRRRSARPRSAATTGSRCSPGMYSRSRRPRRERRACVDHAARRPSRAASGRRRSASRRRRARPRAARRSRASRATSLFRSSTYVGRRRRDAAVVEDAEPAVRRRSEQRAPCCSASSRLPSVEAPSTTITSRRRLVCAREAREAVAAARLALVVADHDGDVSRHRRAPRALRASASRSRAGSCSRTTYSRPAGASRAAVSTSREQRLGAVGELVRLEAGEHLAAPESRGRAPRALRTASRARGPPRRAPRRRRSRSPPAATEARRASRGGALAATEATAPADLDPRRKRAVRRRADERQPHAG